MSTIKLYSSTNVANTSWKLIASKLFKIDNIAEYLAQFSPTTIENVQRIKNGLEISIKLDLSQTYSEPTAVDGIKYISIQNSPSERVNYYFVKHPKWKSTNCVEFELIMDTLNTFNDGSDYVFKKNTRIIREHKNRFSFVETSRDMRIIVLSLSQVSGTPQINDSVKLYTEQGALICSGVYTDIDENYDWFEIRITSSETDQTILDMIENNILDFFELQNVSDPSTYVQFYMESGDATITHNKKAWKHIDYVNENISPMLIRKTAPKSIEKTGILQQNWYLLYRNQDDPSDSLVNPVECYLIPEEETKTNSGYVIGAKLIPSWLEENKMYVFRIGSGESATLSNGASATYNSSYYCRLILTKAGNKINAMFFRLHNDPYQVEMLWQYDDIQSVTFSGLPIPFNVYNAGTEVDRDLLYITTFNYNFTNSEGYSILDEIESLDRTDAKNIKLIKLPYIPYNFTASGDVLQVVSDTNWEYASFTQANGGVFHALHLVNQNTKLSNTIDAQLANPFSLLVDDAPTPSLDDLRTNNDPKLLHSEFYAPTFVYDSFIMRVDLEKCDLEWYIAHTTDNEIKFTMTSTINSKFLFTFTSYHSDKSQSNFENLISVARNNEVVLYNVPYINYIRSGYQYDIKNKNISNISNAIGLGMSVASIGASLLAPSVPLKVAGVVGSLISLGMSVKNTIVTTIQNENSIQQKLQQTQNQTSSVSGSDDVDLMSEYCGNRLLYMIYEPTPNMKNLLDDLFFYAGYNSGRMGVPNHNTRCNFDYLECDAVLESSGANIPQEIIDEIKNAYKVGVTFIHKTTRTTDKWDIEQKYENWENSLL